MDETDDRLQFCESSLCGHVHKTEAVTTDEDEGLFVPCEEGQGVNIYSFRHKQEGNEEQNLESIPESGAEQRS